MNSYELQKVCDQLMNMEKLVTTEWIAYYTIIYNICINKNNGLQLYNNIGDYLIQYLKNKSANIQCEIEGLNNYINIWNSYNNSLEYINKLFNYVNTVVCDYNKKYIEKKLYLYDYGIYIFKQYFFLPLNSMIIKSAMHADFNMITSVFNSIHHTSKQDYIEYIEIPYIQLKKIEYNNVYKEKKFDEYLYYCNQVIKEYEKYDCIYNTTAYTEMCIDSFINNHKDIFYTNFPILLSNNQPGALKLFYYLSSLGNIEYINNIGDIYKTFLLDIGKIRENESENCIDFLQQFYKQYYYCTRGGTITNLDYKFNKIFDDCFSVLINLNIGTRKTAELLAIYTNDCLKKVKPTIDLENDVNDILILLNYIHDKDVYQYFYSKYLCSRLLNSSISSEVEEFMINKLKYNCGYDYTRKFTKMITDINLSKELLKDYKKYIQTNNIEIPTQNILVLSNYIWPLKYERIPECITELPNVLKQYTTLFDSYYNTRFNGKKLLWLHQYSKIELKTNFLALPRIFQTTLYQSIILLLFNKYNSNIIPIDTHLSVDILNQTIQSLILAGICILNNNNLELNVNYTFRKNIVIPIHKYINKSIQKNETTPINHALAGDYKTFIQQDRNIAVQAVIVRLLKTRKTLHITTIIEQVINQMIVSNKFKPTILLIKQMIEILVEKEYIIRDSINKDWYNYQI